MDTLIKAVGLLFLFLSSSVLALDVSIHGVDISLGGFLQGNYTPRIVDGNDFILAEERFQLKLEASYSGVSIFTKTDVFYDAVGNEVGFDIREAYLDYFSKLWDVRVGRQIITWGVGDLIFINDVFPKDFAAFFEGRPLEYLKKGVDAFKFDLYLNVISMEFILIPIFERDTLPSPPRFIIFDPFSQIKDREIEEPKTNLENTQIALRLYRNILGFDASLYIYKGFFLIPAVEPDNLASPTKLILFFPRLAVYGASLQGSVFSGVLSLEGAYYDSLDDRNGDDPAVTNSQTKFLVGFQRELWRDFTAEFQYSGEYMYEYGEYLQTLPPGFPKQDRFRQLMTLRLTQFLRYQTLRLSFFAFFSPSGKDYMLIPEVRYNITDHLWAALGANIFGGKETTFFGQLDKNDNVYIVLRYEF